MYFQRIFFISFSVISMTFGAKDEDKIYGGNFTTIDKVPYIAQVWKDGGFICGGIILSYIWIGTACHCMVGYPVHPKGLVVRAGTTFLNGGGGQSRQVTEQRCHPNYDSKTNRNDFAMMKLLSSLPMTANIQTIPVATAMVPNGAYVKVSGWGTFNKNSGVSNQLRSVFIQKISNKKCAEMLAKYGLSLPNTGICALTPKKDSCSGDSGGPLVKSKKLAGIVSFGIECGKADQPGVYTNATAMLPFIKKTINGN